MASEYESMSTEELEELASVKRGRARDLRLDAEEWRDEAADAESEADDLDDEVDDIEEILAQRRTAAATAEGGAA